MESADSRPSSDGMDPESLLVLSCKSSKFVSSPS
jgi:hypothetical protein